MTHSHRKATSRFEYFRMDVPARHRDAVGKTSWKHSLSTCDPHVAAIKRAEWTAHYKSEVKRLDDLLAAKDAIQAAALVDHAFEAMTKRNGSLDNVVIALLNMLTLQVRLSWGVTHAEKAEKHFGIGGDVIDEAELPDCTPVFISDSEREQFAVKAHVFEGNGKTDGLVHQKLAQTLLAAESWATVENLLHMLSVHTGEEFIAGSTRYNAAAQHFLKRLASHTFQNWPDGLLAAIGQDETAPYPALPLSTQSTPQPVAKSDETHISTLFQKWQSESTATKKTKDEFKSSIDKFIELFGDLPVESITKSHVKQFRTALLNRPARPSQELRQLSLSQQIQIARENDIPKISPRSAKKSFQAIKSILTFAVEEDLLADDPSANVKIDAQPGLEQKRLAFGEDQLRDIYRQGIFTNPDEDEDAIFWFFLLAPFTGARGEELAQLRPGNVRCEDGVWFIGIELDLKAKQADIAASGDIQKRVKTKTSLRKIPVHPTLIAAGFVELAKAQQTSGAEWLFEGLSTNARYESRYQALSQKLNRRLRAFGISDTEYVFHSFRHTLKRRLRGDARVKEEISDLLTGHTFSPSVGRQYGHGVGLRTLHKAICRINYPEVDWAPVVECGRSRLSRRAKIDAHIASA